MKYGVLLLSLINFIIASPKINKKLTAEQKNEITSRLSSADYSKYKLDKYKLSDILDNNTLYVIIKNKITYAIVSHPFFIVGGFIITDQQVTLVDFKSGFLKYYEKIGLVPENFYFYFDPNEMINNKENLNGLLIVHLINYENNKRYISLYNIEYKKNGFGSSRMWTPFSIDEDIKKKIFDVYK